jgi:hypothetical protein
LFVHGGAHPAEGSQRHRTTALKGAPNEVGHPGCA